MNKYRFDCGCAFNQHSSEIKEMDGLPSLSIDFDNLNYNCPDTWTLFGSGNTKGVFQLETQLGRSWSKRVSPWNIEDIAALISIIRPGVLRAMMPDDDGKPKSLTQHYVDRKSGKDTVKYIHEALKPVLENTWGILTFQEQSMRLATELAGFTLQEADVLRKAIGKKDAKIMTSLYKNFLDGCGKTGIIGIEDAKEVFGWIRESQKYAFNKSHGVGYGTVSYYTAYAKTHFPLHFFTSYLYYAKEKKKDAKEEVRELVSDCKLFEIPVYPPTLKTLFQGDPGEVSLSTEGISFGVHDINRIGISHINKLLTEVKKCESIIGKPIHEWNWYEFLTQLVSKINTVVVNGLISCGGLDSFGYSRRKMLFEYSVWKLINEREQKGLLAIFHKHETLVSLLKEYVKIERKRGGPFNARRKSFIVDQITTLLNPPNSLEDSEQWIAKTEKQLLGVSLTTNVVDAVNPYKAITNTCKEFRDGKTGKIVIAVEIIDSRPYKLNKGNNSGKEMGFITAEDSTGSINCVAFAEQWEEFRNLLYKESVVLITGQKGNKDSLVIQKVETIEY